MRGGLFLGLLSVLLVIGHAPARATPITQTIDFSASNFGPPVPPSAPVDPVVGSFTITFDPTINTIFDTADITKNSLNINVGGLAFNYTPGNDTLVIGGQLFGISPVVPTTDDFILTIAGFVNGPKQPFFEYSQQSTPFDHMARNVSVEVSTVPLPPSLLLMMSALGGLTLFAWHRRRQMRTA